MASTSNNRKANGRAGYGHRYGLGSLSMMFSEKKPRINISRESYDQFRYLVQISKEEVEWRAYLSEDTWKDSNGNTRYTIIGDVVIPLQEVSGASADVTDENEIALLEEEFDKGKNPCQMRVWAHSHVNMSVNPSSTDDENLEDIVMNLKEGLVVRMIMNKKDEIRLDIVDVERQIVWEDQDLTINWSLDEDRMSAIKKIHEERVTSKAAYYQHKQQQFYTNRNNYVQKQVRTIPQVHANTLGTEKLLETVVDKATLALELDESGSYQIYGTRNIGNHNKVALRNNRGIDLVAISNLQITEVNRVAAYLMVILKCYDRQLGSVYGSNIDNQAITEESQILMANSEVMDQLRGGIYDVELMEELISVVEDTETFQYLLDYYPSTQYSILVERDAIHHLVINLTASGVGGMMDAGEIDTGSNQFISYSFDEVKSALISLIEDSGYDYMEGDEEDPVQEVEQEEELVQAVDVDLSRRLSGYVGSDVVANRIIERLKTTNTKDSYISLSVVNHGINIKLCDNNSSAFVILHTIVTEKAFYVPCLIGTETVLSKLGFTVLYENTSLEEANIHDVLSQLCLPEKACTLISLLLQHSNSHKYKVGIGTDEACNKLGLFIISNKLEGGTASFIGYVPVMGATSQITTVQESLHELCKEYKFQFITGMDKQVSESSNKLTGAV